MCMHQDLKEISCCLVTHVKFLACLCPGTDGTDLHRMREGYLSYPFPPHRLWRVKQDLAVLSLVSVERALVGKRVPYLRA